MQLPGMGKPLRFRMALKMRTLTTVPSLATSSIGSRSSIARTGQEPIRLDLRRQSVASLLPWIRRHFPTLIGDMGVPRILALRMAIRIL